MTLLKLPEAAELLNISYPTINNGFTRAGFNPCEGLVAIIASRNLKLTG